MAGPAPISAPRQRMIDEFLTESFAELLTHDDRLRGMALDVRFDLGVAHLTGEVDDEKELRLVRRLVGRLDGVLAVWSRVRVAGHTPVIVDLGCGATKQYPEAVGFDISPSPVVDTRADLARPLPVADASVDVVFAVHVLEHLIDFLPLVDECHRVLRPGGILHVLSPWWKHVNAVADPTHVRLFDLQTIKGIVRRRNASARWYPLHAACDGATVYADLTPLRPDDPEPEQSHLARFFD